MQHCHSVMNTMAFFISLIKFIKERIKQPYGGEIICQTNTNLLNTKKKMLTAISAFTMPMDYVVVYDAAVWKKN